MQAVILNGARQGEDDIDAFERFISGELEAAGWTVQAITLRNQALADCVGCFGCWVKTPGECVMRDANREISAAAINADLTVLLSPVVFGGYSSELKKAIDHQIALVSPFFCEIDHEVHHQRRYRHYPDLLAIGIVSAQDTPATAIFRRLVERHARNFHARQHASDCWVAGTPVELLSRRLQQTLRQFQGVTV